MLCMAIMCAIGIGFMLVVLDVVNAVLNILAANAFALLSLGSGNPMEAELKLSGAFPAYADLRVGEAREIAPAVFALDTYEYGNDGTMHYRYMYYSRISKIHVTVAEYVAVGDTGDEGEDPLLDEMLGG
jgi:hypothetical protein